VARRLMETNAFLKSRDERKRVEMRFAHLKVHHGFERMRLRGLSGARDEFHLAAIGAIVCSFCKLDPFSEIENR
jgi:hypothetical protein